MRIRILKKKEETKKKGSDPISQKIKIKKLYKQILTFEYDLVATIKAEN